MLDCLVEYLNTNKIVKPLIKNATLTLSITSDGEVFFLEIKENYFLSITSTNKVANVFLIGEKEALQRVFNGEVLLRDASNHGSIILKGSLRKILLLESLFVLVNANEKKSSFLPS